MAKHLKKGKEFISTDSSSVLNEKKEVNKYIYFLTGLAFVFYFNTVFNEYALDDYLVISKNTYTQQGFAGIPNLISKTSYYGFFKNNNEEVTLRYRPLVMITYAVEVAFLKNTPLLPHASHLINVLIFCLTVIIVFKLCYHFIFKNKIGESFLCTLLFVVHPIHTESVANIKGRDELLSFLFAIASCYYFLKFLNQKKSGFIVLSLLFFTCGLFSKENTVTFLAILPLAGYFFTDAKISELVRKIIPFLIITALFIFIRYQVTGFDTKPSTELLNNPFLHSDAYEKYATIFLSLLYYIKLLIFPHPLSYDYTFNQIPFVKFDDYRVWISIILNATVIIYAIIKLKEKNVISFGILFYFITLVLVTNIFINLGALIGERLVYTPSFGFLIIISFLLVKFYDSIKAKILLAENLKKIFLVMLILICGYKTISRNADWKNNFTLMVHDVKNSSNSMKANDAAAIQLITTAQDSSTSETDKQNYLKQAISLDHKASEILPTFADVYLNLGVSFHTLGNDDSAEYFWNKARSMKPNYTKFNSEYDKVLSNVYFKRGLEKGVEKNYDLCITYLNKAIMYDQTNADLYYNLGGAYFTTGNTDSAKTAFENALRLNPNHKEALNGLMYINNLKK